MLRCNSVASNASSKYMEEDVADVSDVVQTIQRLAHASHALSRAEGIEIQEVAEVSTVVVKHAIVKLNAEAALSPMLFEKSADNTPLVIFKRYSSRLPSGPVVHHKANQTEEFSVQNQFEQCTLPNGRVETRVVVHNPVLLKCWKSAHAVVEVSPQERLEDGAIAGPCWGQWNRTGSICSRCQLVQRAPPLTPFKVTHAQWKPRSSAEGTASLNPFLLQGSRRPRGRNLGARVEPPELIFHDMLGVQGHHAAMDSVAR